MVMTQPADNPELALAAAQDPYEGVPFDPNFFCTILPGRVGALCPGVSKHVPVVLVHLVDGSVLDVCHIAQLSPRWVAMAAFRNAPSCEEMDLHFVPYSTILRVTLSARSVSERQIGFQIDHAASAIKHLETAGGAQVDPDQGSTQ
jgi:hypothetical protein